MSNQLIILNQEIRPYENLFSLNDLHVSSGGNLKHKPSNFIRLDTTKDLIAEIEKDNSNALKVIRGTQGGTYACEELVLAYAMWISPKFHLVVLRAFLNLHKNSTALLPNTITPEQQQAIQSAEEKFKFELTKEEISNITLLLFSHGQMNWLLGKLVKPLEVIGSSYSPTVYGHHTEYKRFYDKSLPVARKFIEPLKQAHRADFEHLLYRLSAN